MHVRTGRATLLSFSASVDRLGLLIAIIILVAVFTQPFALSSPNRIAATQPILIWDSLPDWDWILMITLLLGVSSIMALRSPPLLRMITLGISLVTLLILIGSSGVYLTPEDNKYARISPGSGFWLLIFALCLAVGDTAVKLQLKPLWRIATLLVFAAILGTILYSGSWNDLSIMKEYASYRDRFMNALATHLLLAGGSLLTAFLLATPIGILIVKTRRLRESVLSIFNIIQTIPSMALFGMLIAPLAWVAANFPAAAAIGIAGIGPAPAFIALVAYALLPIALATVTGLDGVPHTVADAARGMGMTKLQRLIKIELPLAFPVVLTGVRVVLVQNIGLAVIAGLVGGGGLGTFVFQGISQTATDLVLLGALPTVAMAFSAAIILDALIELSRGRMQKSGQRYD